MQWVPTSPLDGLLTAADKAHVRLHRLLKRDLGLAVSKTGRGTWTTTSSLPHEIRIESSAGVEFVRVSAGAVIGVRQTKALLETINELNVRRALTKRMWMDDKVLIVAEQPLASLRPGDLEHLVSAVLGCARLDASLLANRGGRATTDLARDYVSEINSWPKLLRVSGTATERELAVWIDGMTGSDCWIDHDSDPEGGPIVVIDGRGTQLSWPFHLMSLFRDVEDLMKTLEEEQEDDEDEIEHDEQGLLAMTLKDLRSLAKEHGVAVARGQSKAELVATILLEAGYESDSV